MRILLFHNITAPYRTPLFDEISKLYNLTVAYNKVYDESRRWNQLDKKNHYQIVLDSKSYNILNRNISIVKVPVDVINQSDIIIVLEDTANLYNAIRIINISRRSNKKIIIWTGAFAKYKISRNILINNIIIKLIEFIKKLYIYKKDFYYWAYSEHSKEYLSNKFKIPCTNIFPGLQGYPDSLVHIPNNIDYFERYNSKKIVYLGYISKRKGIDILLDSFKKFISLIEFSPYKLYLVGDINNISISDQKKIDKTNVILIDYLHDKEKFEFINKCKLLVLPSYSDPWGWVVHEASRIGLPALVSDSVMAKEINNNELLTFKTGNKEDLLFKLISINKLNFQKYLEISEKAVQNARCHDLNKAITSFKNLMKTI